VFEEEVSDIAHVHCESELFELELTDYPPLKKVKEMKSSYFGSALGPGNLFSILYREECILLFLSLPHPAVFRNKRLSLAHAEFVQDVLRELGEWGRVFYRTSVGSQFIICFHSVTSKKRLILDLKYINQCLRTMRVKYEDRKNALSYFMREDLCFF